LLALVGGGAHADVYVVPFAGGTFQGQTTLPLFDLLSPSAQPLPRATIVGVAGLWLPSGPLGVEAELAHVPGVFRDSNPIVDSGSVTSFMGNVIAAAPLALTRESLRPYAVAGVGLLEVRVADNLGVVPLDRSLLGVNLGAGAIGMFNRRAGMRFDVRHTRSVRDDQVTQGIFGSARARVRLSYWRASVGVTVRY
jgi:hypothetical protein